VDLSKVLGRQEIEHGWDCDTETCGYFRYRNLAPVGFDHFGRDRVQLSPHPSRSKRHFHGDQKAADGLRGASELLC
jgi:hypothetical protein